MNKIILLTFIFVFNLISFGQDSDSLKIQSFYVLYNKGDYNKALKEVNDFLLVQKNEEVFNLKSELLLELKKYIEASENYELALKSFPESFVLNLNYGIFLNLAGVNDRSVDFLTNAYELSENNEEKSIALTSRGATYSSFREFEQAYEDLLEALSYDSTNIATLVNLGAVSDEIGKQLEGIQFLKKAVELDPEFSGGYANLGYLSQQLGDYQTAILYYNKVLELDPNEPLGYSNRSYNYMMIGDLNLALKDINKSLKLYETNSYAYMVKGLIQLKNGKKKEACESFETAISYGFTEQYGHRVIQLLRENCY